MDSNGFGQDFWRPIGCLTLIVVTLAGAVGAVVGAIMGWVLR